MARAPHIQPKPARRACQSHDNAVAMRAAKYCAHRPAVELRAADVTGETAATAADLRSRHLEREDLTQEARGGVPVEGKSGFVLSHGCLTSLFVDLSPGGSETLGLDETALVAEGRQGLRNRFD